MATIQCDRCGREIEKMPGVNSKCTLCGENLCAFCAGGWNSDGYCFKCGKRGAWTGLYDRNGKKICEGDVWNHTLHTSICKEILNSKGMYAGEEEVRMNVSARYVVEYNRRNAEFTNRMIYVNPTGVKPGSTRFTRSEIAVGDEYTFSDASERSMDNEYRVRTILVIGSIYNNPEFLQGVNQDKSLRGKV
jgi:uncharacterized phage protein (TIGR01671 family)